MILSLMTDVNQARELALTAADRSDPTPLHEQVAAAIRRAISDGEAGPGDRIPQARDLATVLGVNRNTVLRALRLLRDEGVEVLVAKNAGGAATAAKLTAARELGLPVVMVARPPALPGPAVADAAGALAWLRAQAASPAERGE